MLLERRPLSQKFPSFPMIKFFIATRLFLRHEFGFASKRRLSEFTPAVDSSSFLRCDAGDLAGFITTINTKHGKEKTRA